jgi:hypothetical protein
MCHSAITASGGEDFPDWRLQRRTRLSPDARGLRPKCLILSEERPAHARIIRSRFHRKHAGVGTFGNPRC